MKRKNFWLILVSVSIFFLACNAQVKKQTSEWKEFVSEEGNFKVKFPKTPEQKTRTSPLGDGKIQYPKIEVSLPEIYLSVYFSEVEIMNPLEQNELKNYYDFLRNQTVQLNNSKLISNRDVFLGENMGHEFIESRDNKFVTYRIYLIKNMLYQLKTEIDSSAKYDNEIKTISDKFLDSFQIIKN